MCVPFIKSRRSKISASLMIFNITVGGFNVNVYGAPVDIQEFDRPDIDRHTYSTVSRSAAAAAKGAPATQSSVSPQSTVNGRPNGTVPP